MSKVKKQVVDEIFSPLRRRFPRRKTVQRGIHDTWQADLSILDTFAKYNNGHKYLLCVIDIFSKRAQIEPLKSKRGQEVAAAFKKIFKKYGTTPKNIQVDQGTEFFNPFVKQLCIEHNINLYHSYNKEIKASIVERCVCVCVDVYVCRNSILVFLFLSPIPDFNEHSKQNFLNQLHTTAPIDTLMIWSV